MYFDPSTNTERNYPQLPHAYLNNCILFPLPLKNTSFPCTAQLRGHNRALHTPNYRKDVYTSCKGQSKHTYTHKAQGIVKSRAGRLQPSYEFEDEPRPLKSQTVAGRARQALQPAGLVKRPKPETQGYRLVFRVTLQTCQVTQRTAQIISYQLQISDGLFFPDHTYYSSISIFKFLLFNFTLFSKPTPEWLHKVPSVLHSCNKFMNCSLHSGFSFPLG